MLTRDQLLGATQRRYADVPLPELGSSVSIQSLTEREQTAFERSALDAKGKWSPNKALYWKQRLICLVVVDAETKARMFSDDDVGKLGDIDGAVTSRIFTAALDHLGMTEKDFEELVKNSERIPAADSPSS